MSERELRPSNAKMLYTDEKSTELGETREKEKERQKRRIVKEARNRKVNREE